MGSIITRIHTDLCHHTHAKHHEIHMMKTCLRIMVLLLGLSCLGFFEKSFASTPTQADHVLLFVLEGVSNDVIQNGTMPVLQKLAQEGAVTWKAQSVSP